MSRIPKKIKVGFQDYDVRLVKGLKDRTGDPVFGFHDFNNSEFSFNADVENEDQLVNTVMHEVMHAIWKYMELPTENEEDHVTRLTNGLHTVLKDNPKLLDLFKNGRSSRA